MEEKFILLFSDIHLGADLVQHARPWTVSRLRQAARIDRDLSGMLRYYRSHADAERPWKLIIAGDLVDFIGMSIAPLEGTLLATELTEEEYRHGLGSTGDHAMQKMRAVAQRHHVVFDELAKFLEDGHSLVLIRGNHDVDFHWEQARHAFIEAIVERSASQVGKQEKRTQFERQIEFSPWFYYVEGLLYVEHGHQYDELCSYPNLLAPVSPDDPRRISWSVSDVLLRFIVQPTPGLGSEGHEHKTIFDYFRFGVSMGVKGGLSLFYRYVSAIAHMIKGWMGHLSERATAVRREHDARLEEVASRFRLSREKLGVLSSFWVTPATRRFFAILRSLFVDRIMATLLCVLSLVVLGVLDVNWTTWIAGSMAMLVGVVAVYLWSRHARVLDPTLAMRRGAAKIAQLLQTRYVVMGHTHQPLVVPLTNQTTYINLGGWAVDDLDGPAVLQPCRTHFVIRYENGQHHAELRTWNPDTGPSRYEAP